MGGAVDVIPAIDNSSGATVVTLTFSGAFTSASGLDDGNYQLTVLGDRITSSSGTAMDGDGDGNAGGDFVFGDSASDNFYRFFGESDGNRSVTVVDLLQFRRAWDSTIGDADYSAQFDTDADGDIDVFDLLAFRRNYANTLDFV